MTLSMDFDAGELQEMVWRIERREADRRLVERGTVDRRRVVTEVVDGTLIRSVAS